MTILGDKACGVYKKQQTSYGYSSWDAGANIATGPHNDQRRKAPKAPKKCKRRVIAQGIRYTKLLHPEQGKVREQNGGKIALIDAPRRGACGGSKCQQAHGPPTVLALHLPSSYPKRIHVRSHHPCNRSAFEVASGVGCEGQGPCERFPPDDNFPHRAGRGSLRTRPPRMYNRN